MNGPGLTIGYDGKRTVCNFTGLGNYSRLIIESVAQSMPRSRLLVYTPRLDYSPRLSPMLSHRNVSLRLPAQTLLKWPRQLWRSYGIAQQLRSDGVGLYHGLSGELPLNIRQCRIPSVVTIHDLIFRRHPEYYRPIDRTIYDYKFGRACRDATRIIAISRRTKQDIIEYYGTDPSKIDVIYQGCDPQFTAPVSESDIDTVRRAYKLPQRYIVTVGTVEARKNQLLAVRALSELPADVSLVIVGRQTRYAEQIKAYAQAQGISHRLIWVEGAPFTHLPALYAGAAASTYTSRYEGFGIPVIESIATGTPCVVATGSCLEEAGGASTPAVDPDQPTALARELTRLLDHPDPTIIANARDYIKRFDPRTFTQQIIDTYTKAIDQYAQSR